MPKKTRKEKEKIVEDLKEKIARQKAFIVTKMSGLTVAEANTLRRSVKDASGEFKVAKLTLMRIASQGTPVAEVAEKLTGPMGFLFAYEDPVAVAKALKGFVKEVPKLEVVGGVLAGKVITPKEVESLAELPSREELIAKAVGTIAAPLNNFVGTLAAIPRQFLYVLHAIREQKEKAA
ncbi:MAG: 50S ribosomal protein L10 [Deltaproteobacteria bacterium]|nr:MAG: 50S ribosomal protein L10 [Deltaproteobacteria bacterium]